VEGLSRDLTAAGPDSRVSPRSGQKPIFLWHGKKFCPAWMAHPGDRRAGHDRHDGFALLIENTDSARRIIPTSRTFARAIADFHL